VVVSFYGEHQSPLSSVFLVGNISNGFERGLVGTSLILWLLFGQAYVREHHPAKKGLVTVLLLCVINPRRLFFPFPVDASAARPAFANFNLLKDYGVAGTGLFLNTKAATNPTQRKPIIWIEM